MDLGLGFEPRLKESESFVLPLDEPRIWGGVYRFVGGRSTPLKFAG